MFQKSLYSDWLGEMCVMVVRDGLDRLKSSYSSTTTSTLVVRVPVLALLAS
jgi:hypothetical protein